MPQMAPMAWLSLFIIFSMTFIMFNMMNYYMTIYKSTHKKMSNEKKINSLNWLWWLIYFLFLTLPQEF